MARKKLPEEKKKVKTGITIDSEILDMFTEQLGEKNKSKYIENLIRQDLKKRGFNVEKDF